MEKYTKAFISETKNLSFRNKSVLQSSKACGCFSCTSIFPPALITTWLKENSKNEQDIRCGETALCPVCGFDCVIGESADVEITKELLAILSGEFCELDSENYEIEMKLRVENNEHHNIQRKKLGLPEDDVYTG